jgi:hypothetical protein
MPERQEAATAAREEWTWASGAAERRPARRDGGVGWMVSAALIIGLAGTMNAIYGIAAISRSTFYVQDARYVIGDLRTYGWILLAIGVAQMCASLGLLAWAQWARWIGIVSAGANVIALLLFVPAGPLAALAVFALDLIVLYALVVHGGRRTG